MPLLVFEITEIKFKQIYLTSIEKQVLKTYINLSRFCFLGTTLVLAQNVWANGNPKVNTRSRESNSGPYSCEVDAQPQDHGHHIFDITQLLISKTIRFRQSKVLSLFHFDG